MVRMRMILRKKYLFSEDGEDEDDSEEKISFFSEDGEDEDDS